MFFGALDLQDRYLVLDLNPSLTPHVCPPLSVLLSNPLSLLFIFICSVWYLLFLMLLLLLLCVVCWLLLLMLMLNVVAVCTYAVFIFVIVMCVLRV